MAVFAPDGQPLDSWLLRGGFTTSRPLYVDREDRAWYMLLLDPAADLADWRMGLLRYSPLGEPLDTLPAPASDFEGPFVEARSEGRVSQSSVPFTPRFSWTVTPGGEWLVALSTHYRVELRRGDGPSSPSTPPPMAASGSCCTGRGGGRRRSARIRRGTGTSPRSGGIG